MPFRLARRTRTVWQYRHAMALSGPLATHPGISRVRLPPASPPCCDRTAAKVSHLHSINKRLTAHQRVVAPVAEHRDRVQRRRPVDQGVAEPVRDDAQVPDPTSGRRPAVVTVVHRAGGDGADVECWR